MEDRKNKIERSNKVVRTTKRWFSILLLVLIGMGLAAIVAGIVFHP